MHVAIPAKGKTLDQLHQEMAQHVEKYVTEAGVSEENAKKIYAAMNPNGGYLSFQRSKLWMEPVVAANDDEYSVEDIGRITGFLKEPRNRGEIHMNPEGDQHLFLVGLERPGNATEEGDSKPFLTLHLVCFETKSEKPLVVACQAGISEQIDANGNVRKVYVIRQTHNLYTTEEATVGGTSKPVDRRENLQIPDSLGTYMTLALQRGGFPTESLRILPTQGRGGGQRRSGGVNIGGNTQNHVPQFASPQVGAASNLGGDPADALFGGDEA